MRIVRVLLAVAVAGLLLLPGVPDATAAAGRPSYIPPDGPAGPVKTLSAIRSGSVATGSPVTTQTVTVSSVSCPSCSSPTVAADFVVRDSAGVTLRVHEPNTWQATWNVKKENWLPRVGMPIVVQGVASVSGSEHYITMKRFGVVGGSAPTVRAKDAGAGAYREGTYVWLAPVKILNVGHWDDGDWTFDVRDDAGGRIVHLELSAPFSNSLRVPHKGDVVQPFGTMHYDSDHAWWEIHPVRCWKPGECAPGAASYVRNAPPPGSPSSGGYFTEGGPVPLSASGGSTSGASTGSTGTFSATFTHPVGNEWWVQIHVTGSKSIVGVDAQVNGGAWIPLVKQSWGDWAKSIHAGDANVRFRAHASDGSTALSGVYPWPPY